LDYLRWLLGEVESLSAFTDHTGLDMPVEDTAEISLRFKNGALGSVHLDYIQNPTSHWLEIIGTQGTLRWDNADGITRLTRINREDNTVSLQEIFPPEGFERNWMFLDELRHFRDVLNGVAEPVCTLQDGIQALRISLGALASSQQGQIINM
jgi:predicted dehydrogenase